MANIKLYPIFINIILLIASINTGVIYSQNIDVNLIQKHLEFLASDFCEGRAPGSAGEERAANYIKNQLFEYGLIPIGDDNTYFQQVPMHASLPLPSTDFKLYLGSTETSLILNDDYLLYKGGASTFVPSPLPLVFVGYGIIAPEFDYNDYQNIDVSGKIVVFLSGEPPSDDPEYFKGKMETIYSNPDSKQRIAISRGASGSIMILRQDDREWNYWQKQFQFEDISLAYSASANLSILLNPTIAKTLFSKELYNLKDIFDMHKNKSMISFELSSKLSIKSFFKERDFVAKNVIAMLEGTNRDYRDSYLLLSAHYDHLGIGPEVNGDSIYNGAFDNAAGVSVLLEIARYLSLNKNTIKRSIIFLFTTGEEKGLLGATYYTDNPKKPLYKTIANINVDGISSFGKTNDFTAYGLEYSDIKNFMHDAIASNSVILYNSPYFYLMESESINRSDHFAFAKAGIPFLIVLEGFDYQDKSGQIGLQQLYNWHNNIYHTPFDDINQDINYEAVKQHTDFLLDLCFTFSNHKNTPQWRSDSPFLLRRLQSIAEGR